jgi:hypothetical protein
MFNGWTEEAFPIEKLEKWYPERGGEVGEKQENSFGGK